MSAFQSEARRADEEKNELRELIRQFKKKISDLEMSKKSLGIFSLGGIGYDEAFDKAFECEMNYINQFCYVMERYCEVMGQVVQERSGEADK